MEHHKPTDVVLSAHDWSRNGVVSFSLWEPFFTATGRPGPRGPAARSSLWPCVERFTDPDTGKNAGRSSTDLGCEKQQTYE